MQEASVSSTTSSPKKYGINTDHAGMNVSLEKPAESANLLCELKTETKIKRTHSKEDEHERSHHRHKPRRLHTCSKAHRKSHHQRSSRRSYGKRKSRRSNRLGSPSRRSFQKRHRRHRPRSSTNYSRSSSESSSKLSLSSKNFSNDSLLKTSIVNLNNREGEVIKESQACLIGTQSDSEEIASIFRSCASPSQMLQSLSQVANTSLPACTLANPLLRALNSPNQSPASLAEIITTKLPYILSNSVVGGINQQLPSSATRQARRLYIGGIPPAITSETMVAFFNSEFRMRGLCRSAYDPVISAQVNSDRRFAFIELRSMEETTEALNLDGTNCYGSCLRIRRPRDYIHPTSLISPLLDPSSPGTQFSSPSTNSVFVCGFPQTMEDAQIQGLLDTLGTIKSIKLVKDPVTSSFKGCAFLEFPNTEAADSACTVLSNVPMDDRKLFAIRADYLAVGCRCSVGTITNKNSGPLDSIFHSRVICLSNMISPEDIASPDEYTDIFEDVRSECKRHGDVLSMQMPRPITGQSMVPGLGQIFVEYASVLEAAAACAALGGRRYMGRKVQTSFFDVHRYFKLEF